jgi:hypothetical protein
VPALTHTRVQTEVGLNKYAFIRPVRDEMNLARHFSAGNSENKQMSPVGTIE